jgi:5-methylcytosine-specific restriction endonuclease McrA
MTCPFMLRSGKSKLGGSSHDRRRRRAAVAKRDNFTCRYCNAYAPHGNIDHIIPKSLGGAHGMINLAWACRPCNTRKENLSAEALMSLIHLDK